MVPQLEHHITIGFPIVGSICMGDAPFVEGGVYLQYYPPPSTMGAYHIHMLPTIINHIVL